MSKLSKLLEKAGLIELETPPESVTVSEERLADSTDSVAMAQAPAPPAATDANDGDDYVLPEGMSADAIYSEAAIPASTYTVERLAKLVDGLRQLDSATQRAAILAMDAADDTWAIEDIVQDARKKIAALRDYSQRAADKVLHIQAKIGQDIQRLNGDKEKAIKDIQGQIADLQQLLEATTSKHAAEIAKLNAQAASAQQAADRERVRISEQVAKISALIQPFVTTSNP